MASFLASYFAWLPFELATSLDIRLALPVASSLSRFLAEWVLRGEWSAASCMAGCVASWFENPPEAVFVWRLGELHSLCISREDGGEHAACVGADKTLRVCKTTRRDPAACCCCCLLPLLLPAAAASGPCCGPCPLLLPADGPRCSCCCVLLHVFAHPCVVFYWFFVCSFGGLFVGC